MRAHWDLTSEQQRHYNALSASGHLVLRLYFEPPAGSPTAELHLHPDSSHWFIHVAQAGRRYAAELGYYQADRQWRALAISDTVQTPPETLAQEKTVRFATIPWERRPGSEDTPSSRPATPAPMPAPPFVTRQVRFETAGPSSPLPPAAALPPELKRPADSSSVPCHQAERGISSQTPIQLEFVAPVLVSLSSPIEAGPPEEKAFWLNINAELIIYGATAPDAQVSLAGRPIRLRPDGTFSYRFALPDGKYELAVSALSPQGELRQAELSFSRDTRYQGEVGPHTQDPALQPPPGHVG
jgi:hypothetical protein